MSKPTTRSLDWEEAESPEQVLKRTNYLLVISIDEYVHCPVLYNCVKDAEDLIRVLTERYFFEEKNITKIYNAEATRGNIHKAFRRLATKMTPTDNLIVYYSGHGEFDKIFRQGYWIPVDAPQGEHDRYIPNGEIKTFLTAVKSHHTVLLSDSCFSGALFASGSGKNLSRRYEADPSRWGLTAGRNEIVSDGKPGMNSPFAESLLYRLRHADRAFGMQELCAQVTEYVDSNSNQTPIGEPLKIPGHKNGQFVFHLKKDALTDWKNAEKTDTVAAYSAFIKMHPDDPERVAAARLRMDVLQAENLWETIKDAPEATDKEIRSKKALVREFCEKYTTHDCREEALDLDLYLDYKREFLRVKDAKQSLQKFAEAPAPNVPWAAEVKQAALDILAGKKPQQGAVSAPQEKSALVKTFHIFGRDLTFDLKAALTVFALPFLLHSLYLALYDGYSLKLYPSADEFGSYGETTAKGVMFPAFLLGVPMYYLYLRFLKNDGKAMVAAVVSTAVFLLLVGVSERGLYVERISLDWIYTVGLGICAALCLFIKRRENRIFGLGLVLFFIVFNFGIFATKELYYVVRGQIFVDFLNAGIWGWIVGIAARK